MLTMLIGGLWHGAGWTFVVWGCDPRRRARRRALVARPAGYVERPSTAWRRAWQRFLTFQIVCFAWIFFRSDSFSDAWDIIVRLLHGLGGALGTRHGRSAARDRGGIGSQYLPRRLPLVSWHASRVCPCPLRLSSSRSRSSPPTPGARGRGPVHLLPVLMTGRDTRVGGSVRTGGACTPPGAAIVVALLALLIGALLNAPGLEKSARSRRRAGSGTSRSPSGAASTADSDALRLDEPAAVSRPPSGARTTTRSTRRRGAEAGREPASGLRRSGRSSRPSAAANLDRG